MCLFAITIGTMLWHIFQLQSDLIETSALNNANAYISALEEVRTLYTSDVVKAAREYGLEISHDYKNKEGAIPLPATFSMKLGERLGTKKSGVISRLYSPYPFPWRENTMF